MPSRNDGRRQAGAHVVVKAKAVTSPAECKQLFGLLWKEKLVSGVVQRVVTPPTGSGKQVSIVAERRLGTVAKLKEVKLIKVKLADTVPPNGIQPTDLDSVQARLPPTTQTANKSETILSQENTDAQEGRTNADCNVSPSHTITVTSHGLDWTLPEIAVRLNGTVPRRQWSVLSVSGESLGEGQGVPHLSPFDFFMKMFPMSHLEQIESLTNTQLQQRDRATTNSSEILRFFGVIILMSRYQFVPRR